jgi:hypothetical protein
MGKPHQGLEGGGNSGCLDQSYGVPEAVRHIRYALEDLVVYKKERKSRT